MTEIEIEKKINELISSMTLKEKVGQLNQVPFDDIHSVGIEEKIEKGEIGAIILYWGAFAGEGSQKAVSIERLNELQEIAVTKSPSKIPLIFGKDVIHGHYTVYPIPLAIAASFNPELVEESYSSIAEEATSAGIDWTFTPMLDMARDPRWGRIVEGCGEDPYLASVMAKAMIGGLQGDDYSKDDKLAACAKHYIGYGASEAGRDYHKAEISDYSLRNLYLPAFKSAVNSGVSTIMSSFNEVSGEPVTSSKYLLNELLKDELGFDGFVVSDYGSVEQLELQGVAEDRAECAKLSINAGLDMDMASLCYSENLEELVNNGEVQMSAIDEAVRRVLRVKARCGLFDNPYKRKVALETEEHIQQAKELAAETLVLLKNENSILPLDKSKKYVLAGPMAKSKKDLFGTWTLDGDPSKLVSIDEGLKAVMNDGCIINAQSDMISDILSSMVDYDTAIVICGEGKNVTGEFRCLANIDMPKEQTELLKNLKAMGKMVIAVMCFARPVGMEEAEKYCDAILYAWHAGTMSGAAIADVLVGNISPSGKLPVTLPRCTGQVPIYYNVPPSGRPVNGYYEEVRNYLDVRSTPLYPFGYGLSYTEFEFSKVTVFKSNIAIDDLYAGEKFKVSIKVKNIGECGGKAVVQCYINDRVSEMTRPIRELKSFSKMYIDKGNETIVEFEIGTEELGYYNRDGLFMVEKGKFDIYVGQDCYAKEMCTIEVI